MAGIKWILSHLVAGILVTGAIAAPAPQQSSDVASSAVSSPPSAVPSATSTLVPDVSPEVDLASEFVAQLISNATQAGEEFLSASKKRGLTCGAQSSLVVHLGYAKYQGYSDAASGLNIWKG